MYLGNTFICVVKFSVV